MKKVTITADKDGIVVHQSANNPKFGWYKVEQVSLISSNGFEREVTLSAIVNGDFEMLKRNKVAGATMDGVIVVKESTTPFNKENPRSLGARGNIALGTQPFTLFPCARTINMHRSSVRMGFP